MADVAIGPISEADALEDVLRLSHGITYKNAPADLPFGGGKSVIIAGEKTHKSEALFRSMGKCVQSLNGTYRVSEDVGTTHKEMAVIREETPFAEVFQKVAAATFCLPPRRPVSRRPCWSASAMTI